MTDLTHFNLIYTSNHTLHTLRSPIVSRHTTDTPQLLWIIICRPVTIVSIMSATIWRWQTNITLFIWVCKQKYPQHFEWAETFTFGTLRLNKTYSVSKLPRTFIFLCASVCLKMACLEMADPFFSFFCQKLAVFLQTWKIKMQIITTSST